MKKIKKDNLSVQIYDKSLDLAEAAATIGQKYISEAIEKKGFAVIVLASAGSQIELHELLVKKSIKWENIFVFHLRLGMLVRCPGELQRLVLSILS